MEVRLGPATHCSVAPDVALSPCSCTSFSALHPVAPALSVSPCKRICSVCLAFKNAQLYVSKHTLQIISSGGGRTCRADRGKKRKPT
eukprot:scaffold166877_cov15-Tisochrysis_lutea.AAC.1